MPISYRIDERQKLVVTTVHGCVSEAEVRAHAAAARDPKFQACERSIIEISESAELMVDARVVAELAMAGEVPEHAPGRRAALIAPSDASYGLARVFQGFRAGTGSDAVRVFRTRAEADAWLGVEAPMESKA